MLISIISDTHDNMPYIKKAIERLNKINSDLVIHCGDFSAQFAAAPYMELKSPLVAVFGNNDAEKNKIGEKLEQAGKKVAGSFTKIELDNRRIAVTHGDNVDLLNSLIETQSFDIVAYGHSHQTLIERRGKVLVLNPGEVCGYLSGKHTFATVDTQTLKTQVITL